ncbi:MAG: hypothetical protein KJZ92_14275 [Rhodocyclaceae bacterium]|nr:hypothetical protein [Rhodocyclaceae bacterium]
MSAGTAQRAALLAALRSGPISSIAARETLGILHPPARIMELRRQGIEIETVWKIEYDSQGRRHRAGIYVLKVAA